MNCDVTKTFLEACIVTHKKEIAKFKRPVPICEDCLPIDSDFSIVVRGSSIRVQRAYGDCPWIRPLYKEMMEKYG